MMNNICKLYDKNKGFPLNQEYSRCNLLDRSRINMRDMLPESEREDTLLLHVLEDRRLAYLCPYLKFRVQLFEKLSPSIDPHDLFSYIEYQTSIYDKHTQSFIQTLVTCIYETAISPTFASSKLDKAILNQEKIFLENHRQTLQTYLKTIEQQVWALYALQLIAYQKNFPKEFLLRLFVYSYDLDIIEEDAYLKWKEDLNDDIPGKGKALFQVSKWLQWLEHASEESDDDHEENSTDNGHDQEIRLNDKVRLSSNELFFIEYSRMINDGYDQCSSFFILSLSLHPSVYCVVQKTFYEIKSRTSISERNISIFISFLQMSRLLTYHENVKYQNDVIDLLNDEWPQSKTIRLRRLERSCEQFPLSYILIDQTNQQLLGYCYLDRLYDDDQSVILESVCINRSLRGQGLINY